MPKRTRSHHEWLLEQLIDPVFAADYLNEARRDSQKHFLKALRNVAEARRMAVVAVEAGVNRESLYKSLSEDGNPRLETYDSVLSAVGLDYDFKPKQQPASAPVGPMPPNQIDESTEVILIVIDNNQKLSSLVLTEMNIVVNLAGAPTGISSHNEIEDQSTIEMEPYMAAAMLQSQMQEAR